MPPASGPKRTAANSVSTGEIESSVVSLSRTDERSAIAAAAHSATSTHTLPDRVAELEQRHAGRHRQPSEAEHVSNQDVAGPNGVLWIHLIYPSNGVYDASAVSSQPRSKRMRKAFVRNLLRAMSRRREGLVSRQILVSVSLVGIPPLGDRLLSRK